VTKKGDIDMYFDYKNNKVDFVQKISFEEIKSFLVAAKILEGSEITTKDFGLFEYRTNENGVSLTKSIFNDSQDKIVVHLPKREIFLYNFSSSGLSDEENEKWLKFMLKKYQKTYFVQYRLNMAEKKQNKAKENNCLSEVFA